MPYTLQNIIDWYQAVQFRDGNPATVDSYLHLLNASALTQDQVLQAILDEQYTKDFVNPVIRLYQAAFDRIPDQSGQNFWVDNLAAGDWAIGAADQAHAQFVLVGTDTLAFDPDGTGATAAITVVGHYTYTGLTGTMIALTA